MEKFTLWIDTFGNTTAPEEWRLKSSIEMQRLYYIKSGKGRYQENGCMKDFIPGKIYLFPYNLQARFETDSEEPIDHIYFDFVSMPPIISKSPIIYEAIEYPEIMKMVQLMDILSASVKRDHMDILYSVLDLLLRLLWNRKPLPFSTDTVVCEVQNYIHQHYAEYITIAQLAAFSHLEENYFIRRFKNEVGQTPYAYLKRYRLLRAREYIAKGKTVAQTAALVGYENASSLTRALHSLAD